MFVFSYSRRDVEASNELARVVGELGARFGSALRRMDDPDAGFAESDPVQGLLVVFGPAWRRELDEPASSAWVDWSIASVPQLRVVVLVVRDAEEPVELPDVVQRRASRVLTFSRYTDGLVTEVVEATLQRTTPDRRRARDELDRGRVFYKERRYGLAIACFEAALNYDPDYAEAALRLGMAHDEDRNVAKAVAAYERCLDIDPEHFHAATNIGEVYRKNERYDEAIGSYDRALALKDDYLYALAGRAECLRMLGDLPGCLVWFDRALEVGSRHSFAIQGKAAALNTLLRYADALPLWRRAVELEPDGQFALEGLAFCEQNLPSEADPALVPGVEEARLQLEIAAGRAAGQVTPTLRACLQHLVRANGQSEVPHELGELFTMLRGDHPSKLEWLADWIALLYAASVTGRADPVVVVEMINGIATLRDELSLPADE